MLGDVVAREVLTVTIATDRTGELVGLDNYRTLTNLRNADDTPHHSDR